MLLIIFLSYYHSKRVNTDLPVLLFPTFGIKSGGTFMANISECASERLFIGLSVDEQIDTLWDSKFNYGKVCEANTLNFSIFNLTIKVDNENGNKINKVIKHSTVVTPIFIMCDTNYTTLNATVVFKNPKSYLDSRYTLIAYLSSFVGALCIILLLILIISIISKSVPFLKYHIYLIATILSVIIEKFFQLCYYLQLSKNPEILYFFYLHYAFKVLSSGLLFSSITLACGGWQIHTVRFKLLSFLFSLFSGFCYGCTDIFPVLVLRIEPDFISYLIQILSFVVFVKVSVVELRTCEQYLQSYALIIDTVGIDSKTTPVSKRIWMQSVMLGSLFIYFLAKIFIINIPLFFCDFSICVIYVIRNGFDLLFLTSLTFNYMPWKVDMESWIATFDDEDKLADCAMEDFNPEGYAVEEKPIKWKPGDKLPHPPLIATSEFRIQPLEISDREMPLIDSQKI